MAEYNISDKSAVLFHDLFRGEEEDGFVMVGRRDIGSYVSVPVEALEIIDLLNSGIPVGEVIEFSQEKYGEDIEDIPMGAVGIYTYCQKFRVGLQQLMAGSRNFKLSTISRKDLMALTEEASKISGVPYVMTAYGEEANRIIEE